MHATNYQLSVTEKRTPNAARRLLQSLSVGLALVCVSSTAQNLNLSGMPLFLSDSTEPNLLLTVDDSLSMRWGFAGAMNLNKNDDDRPSWNAAGINAIAYNPEIDYRPAPNFEGVSLGNGGLYDASISYEPEADFNAAIDSIFRKTLVDKGQPFGGYVDEFVNLATSYLPPRIMSVNLNNRAEVRGVAAAPAYYTVLNPTNAGCRTDSAQWHNDDDCFDTVVVSATSGPLRERPELGGAISSDERTNFANWYQYYSTRILAAISALSLTYTPDRVPDHIRVASQTMTANAQGIATRFLTNGGPYPGPKSGNRNNDRAGGNPFVVPIESGPGTERDYFYDWLYGMVTNCCTPIHATMKTAGEFLSQTGVNSAFSTTPGTAGGQDISCRVNAHITMTDGAWTNIGTELPSLAGLTRDEDPIAALPGGGPAYAPNSGEHYIYGDGQANYTISDAAFHFWASDLRPDLADNVPPYMPDGSNYWSPRNDPATWQHMTNYTVAFGVAGRVPLGVDETGLNVYDQLVAGQPFTNIDGNVQTGWTATTSGDGKLDDLYHAAINSRGQFFSATAPQELVDSLSEVINAISDRNATASAVNINSRSVSAGSGVYQARFETGEWTGELTATPISDGVSGGPCNSQPTGTVCSIVWAASTFNDQVSLRWSRRAIYSYRPDFDLGSRGIRFRWSPIGAASRNVLHDGGTVGQGRLQYLRGNSNLEERFGGTFRDRSDSRVGPIIHSSPAYVGNGFQANGTFDLVYADDIENSGAKHRDWICTSPSFVLGKIDSCSSGIWSRTPMVYVGANDGMLHAYDARLTGGGKEKFAYIPHAVMENLPSLTRPSFTNGSFVDGAINTADVFYDNDWHTILVSGLRTGGQSYFALDITNPDDFSNESDTNARDLVRWEFDDPDLGYTYGKPLIVKSNDTSDGSTGRWVAIFGNGYNATESDGSASVTGRAFIFVVDIKTGTLIKKIDTGSGTLAAPNAIADVTAVFSDSGYTIDYVYAGDLNGNIWKIDMRSDSVADWDVAYQDGGGPAPLFTTDAGQTISAAPRVGGHPLGGNLVYFGTGKYIENSDNTSTDLQRFYAIWDKDICTPVTENGSCASTTNMLPSAGVRQTITLSDLQAQQIQLTTGDARTTTDSAIDWTTNLGWYLDFEALAGERSVGQPVLRGSVVLFTTILPDGDECSAGGESWLYALNRFDGGRAPVQIFDHSGDGNIDSGDYLSGDITSATRFDGVIRDPTFLSDAEGMDHILIGLQGGVGSEQIDLHLNSRRVRWRQLQ